VEKKYEYTEKEAWDRGPEGTNMTKKKCVKNIGL
jgi:hypothetical protein